MKKLVSVLLAITIVFTLFTGVQFSSNAVDLPSSGSCGENVTYTFDSSTGVLTISGKGKMFDFSSGAHISYSPFYANSNIKRVIINKGVENIGQDIFFDCKQLTEIVIADTVTDLVQGCFWGCSKLASLKIPSSVLRIGDYMFVNCDSFTDLYYDGNKTQWADVMFGGVSFDMLATATIHGKDFSYRNNNLIHRPFTTSGKEYLKRSGFYYTDTYFSKIATEYNHSLATMSLCLAFSTYQSDDGTITFQNAKQVLDYCGFENIKAYGYDNTTQKDGIAAIIGAKSVEGKKLISVAVRSGGYGAEWSSNAKVDSYGDHFGFDQSADKVQSYIYSYIKDNMLEGNIKIWISGFSRGGAVATQTAAKLNNAEGVAYTVKNAYKTVKFGKNSIYAYGFATPAGAIKDSNPHDSKYNNIFSVIDYNDPVPLVAPAKWGFDRYGITKVLPYRESNNSKEFSKYYKRICDRMGSEYKINSFKNYTVAGKNSYANAVYQKFNKDTLGTFNKKLVNALAGTIGTRQKYYSSYQNEIMKFLEKEMGKNDLDIGLILQEACNLVPRMSVLHPNLTITLINNLSLLADVHANQTYYLSWMQLMDPNYANNLPLIWGNSKYRVASANCPVDLKVFDSNGELVAAIINEVPQEIENSTTIASIDENDQKIVYLPIDEEYDVQIIPRDNCQVTYGMDEINAEDGEQVRSLNYSEIDLKKSETIIANAPAISEDGSLIDSDIDYTLMKDEEVITPDSDIKGIDEIEKHTYSVTVNNDDTQGTVYGEGSYVQGSFVKLIAENNPGYDFEGFYINEKRIIDDDLDNNRYSVRFEVKGNTEIDVKYVVCEHKNTTEKKTMPTETQVGKIEHCCSTCGYTQTETIPVLDHNYVISVIKSTSTNLGYEKHTCSYCGKYYIDSFTAPTGRQKIKCKARIASAQTVMWNKVETATGYQVQISSKDGKKWSTHVTLKAGVTTYTFKKLATGNNYKFRVRFYISAEDGKNYFSPWSATLNSPTLPTGTTIKKLTPAKKAFTAQWKKNAAVNGYQIQYSLKSNFSGAKTITVKSPKTLKAVAKKLNGGKYYYVRIRTYKTVSKVNYFSAWSKTYKVKSK